MRCGRMLHHCVLCLFSNNYCFVVGYTDAPYRAVVVSDIAIFVLKRDVKLQLTTGPWLELNSEPRPLHASRSTAHDAQVIRPLDYTGRPFKDDTAWRICAHTKHIQKQLTFPVPIICQHGRLPFNVTKEPLKTLHFCRLDAWTAVYESLDADNILSWWKCFNHYQH